MVRIAALILGLQMLFYSAYSQNQADYFGVSSMSLGGIQASLQGSEALFANSAGLTQIDGLVAEANFINRFGLSDQNRMGIALAHPIRSGVLALKLAQFQAADLSEQHIGLSYAHPLSKDIRLAATLAYIGYSIDTYGSTSTVAGELGVQAKALTGLTLAAYLIHPGQIDLTEGRSLPSTLEIGASYKPGQQLTIHSSMRKAIDRSAEFMLGVQYQLHERLGLRLGANATTGEFASGVDISITDQFVARLAFNYHNNLGGSPGLSLGYR